MANQGKSLNTVGGEAALRNEIAESKNKPKVKEIATYNCFGSRA
jgi:hypothetical protein